MNQLLTVQQVADCLQLHYRTVLNLILLGELSAYKIGGKYRVAESDLDQYLKSVKVRSEQGR